MPVAKPPRPKRADARIFLVDDHPILREGLSVRIRAEPGLSVCGEAETAQQALQLIPQRKPDLAIVDISLEDSHGLELIKDLRAICPALRILVLSMHDESLYAERVLHAGAMGYVMKREPPQKLVRAIRQVLADEIYLSEAMTKQMLRAVATARSAARVTPLERLSDRELEVFELIGQGHQPRVIARKLHRSVKTIEYHRDNIKRKLELRSAEELAPRAVQWVQAGRAGPS
jgi:DNA-binding NarL/FixJ family response regulator